MSPPIRPANIRKIKMILEIIVKSRVIPRVKPTVAIADAVSYIAVIIGTFSMTLIIIAAPTHNEIYNIKIVAALRTTVSGIVLPKLSVRERFLKIAILVVTKTKKVVIFIPPPVEPGAAPININIICKKILDSVIFVRSTVLNPAVRGVTDWKKDARILDPKGMPVKSTKKK